MSDFATVTAVTADMNMSNAIVFDSKSEAQGFVDLYTGERTVEICGPVCGRYYLDVWDADGIQYKGYVSDYKGYDQ